MIVELLSLIAGMVLVIRFSEKTVECSTHLATRLKVPPLLIGVFLVSAGTDLPEIANSVISSYTGHGDINVGDTLGSSLSQISLILGLVAIFGGGVIGERRNILVLGGCATVAVAAAAFTVMDGVLDQFDAAVLLALYAVLLFASSRLSVEEAGAKKGPEIGCMKNSFARTSLIFIGSLALVAIGAGLIVDSVVKLSSQFGIAEYFVSFFAVGIGTSLPELSVELAAVRKKQYGIALGDLMGSNITDATIALGLGPLLFPTAISHDIIAPLAIYLILASVVIVGLFAWREKIDRKAALLLIMIYLFSFLFVV